MESRAYGPRMEYNEIPLLGTEEIFRQNRVSSANLLEGPPVILQETGYASGGIGRNDSRKSVSNRGARMAEIGSPKKRAINVGCAGSSRRSRGRHGKLLDCVMLHFWNLRCMNQNLQITRYHSMMKSLFNIELTDDAFKDRFTRQREALESGSINDDLKIEKFNIPFFSLTPVGQIEASYLYDSNGNEIHDSETAMKVKYLAALVLSCKAYYGKQPGKQAPVVSASQRIKQEFDTPYESSSSFMPSTVRIPRNSDMVDMCSRHHRRAVAMVGANKYKTTSQRRCSESYSSVLVTLSLEGIKSENNLFCNLNNRETKIVINQIRDKDFDVPDIFKRGETWKKLDYSEIISSMKNCEEQKETFLNMSPKGGFSGLDFKFIPRKYEHITEALDTYLRSTWQKTELVNQSLCLTEVNEMIAQVEKENIYPNYLRLEQVLKDYNCLVGNDIINPASYALVEWYRSAISDTTCITQDGVDKSIENSFRYFTNIIKEERDLVDDYQGFDYMKIINDIPVPQFLDNEMAVGIE